MAKGIEFPERYFDPAYHQWVELPNFLADPKWMDEGRKLIGDPPADNSPEPKKELEELLLKQNDSQRGTRKPDIDAEQNAMPEAFNRLLLFDDKSHPRTHELAVRVSVTLGLVVGQYFKHLFMRPRPSQLEPQLRPLLKVPGHPAYPSGHSLQGHWEAHVLAEFAPHARTQLFEIAKRFAENREWAGLHYPSDTEAGRKLAEHFFPRFKAAYSKTFEAARKEWGL
jgi:hypothetical protein